MPELKLTFTNDGKLQSSSAGFNQVPADRDTFLKYLADSWVPYTGLLPSGVRWHSPGLRYWLVEIPKQVRTLTFYNVAKANINSKTKAHEIDLPLPTMVMLIEINANYFPVSTMVFALPKSSSFMTQQLGMLPLPNLYKTGEVCYPTLSPSDYELNSVADAIGLSYNLTWESPANRDLTDAFGLAVSSKTPSSIFSNIAPNYTSMLAFLHEWSKKSLDEVESWAYLKPYNNITHEYDPTSPMPSTLSSLKNLCSQLNEHENQTLLNNARFLQSVQSAYSKALVKPIATSKVASSLHV